MNSAVMSLYGTVRWTVKRATWSSWTTIVSEDIPAGWYNAVRLSGGGPFGNIDFSARTTVDQADGDTYSMCTQFR